nr:PREDICTED: uncharacterized protein LOC109032584 isoform X1 [Bemisia tabaci]
MSKKFSCYLSSSGKRYRFERQQRNHPETDSEMEDATSETSSQCDSENKSSSSTIDEPNLDFPSSAHSADNSGTSPFVEEHIPPLDNDYHPPLFDDFSSDESEVSSTRSTGEQASDESSVDVDVESCHGEEPHQDEADNPCLRVEKFLTDWAFETSINQKQLTSLCHGLNSAHPECFSKLHLDARTYFKTPRGKTNAREMNTLNSESKGKYIHISMRKQLETLVLLLPAHVTELILIINIDGLPLIKGGVHELWPILMRLLLLGISVQVMPVGLYYGPGKPADNDEFLREFVEEVKVLVQDNLEVNGKTYKVIVPGFTCDSPAKALLLGICYPNGYFSCTRCHIEGEDLKITTVRGENVKVTHKRVFIDTNCRPRTDAEFRTRTDTVYQPAGRGTPLVEIPGLDMVKGIFVDYLHLVLHGTMKYFLTFWFGTEPSKFKLSATAKSRVSRGIRKLNADVPCEFARQKPRELKVLAFWKATEFRFFLLYLGPVLLKDVLHKQQYDHFIMLHLAITILVSPKYCSNAEQISYAKNLLKSFVDFAPEVYSEIIMVHNLHNLIHLADDVTYFQQFFPGVTLDTISTFWSENFLQQMKKMSKAHSKKLEQIGKRIGEAFQSAFMQGKRVTVLSKDVTFKDIHTDGPLPGKCRSPQYRTILFSSFKITTKRSADSICLLDTGEVMCVENVAFNEELHDYVVIGNLFTGLSDLYSTVCNSSRYGIYTASGLSPVLKVYPVTGIVGKYIQFHDDDKDGFFLFPEIHTLQ